MIVRPGRSMLVIGDDTAALLERHCNLTKLRGLVRGREGFERVSQELLDIRTAAMSYEPEPVVASAASVSGLPFAEVGPASEERFSVREAAGRLGVTTSAVRQACRAGRLNATRPEGRWEIGRRALEEFKTMRDRSG